MYTTWLLTIERLLSWLLKLVLALWALLITWLIVRAYHNYFPAQFQRGFLEGRQTYFYSIYAVGFYLHILSAPPVFVIGLVQSTRLVRRYAIAWHERLGQIYCHLILWCMVPGGFIMSFHAIAGRVSMVAFITLSCFTWWFTYQGWKSIGKYEVTDHGRWMCRSFILVSSAIVLRILAMIAGLLHLTTEQAYPWMAWLSWLPGWLMYEVILWRHRSEQVADGS